MTALGRQSQPPTKLIKEMGGVGTYKIKLTNIEETYNSTMRELGKLAFVGGGLAYWLVSAFENTQELKQVMKFDEAITTDDCDKWKRRLRQVHEHGPLQTSIPTSDMQRTSNKRAQKYRRHPGHEEESKRLI